MTFVPAIITSEDFDIIDCQFIPDQLVLHKGTTWANQRAVGQALPRQGFMGVTPGTLTLTLWFDGTQAAGDVAGDTAKLLKLLKPRDSLANDIHPAQALPARSQTPQHRPPTVTFQWGATLSFKCILKDCTVTYKLFDDSGRPLRATAACTFQQVAEDDSFGPQNPTSGGRTGERVHRLAPRETLEHVAFFAFGKTSLWRALASFNGIDDPMRVKAGDPILLPASADDLTEWA